MKIISITIQTEAIKTDERGIYRRNDSAYWERLTGGHSWESLYPSRARELEIAYQAFKEEQDDSKASNTSSSNLA